MTRLAIIIPVKPLHEGKSRLANVLSPEARRGLNRELMLHTFDRAATLRDIAVIYVVSRSQEVLAEAERRGFRACLETRDSGLNAALSQAATLAAGAGADRVMVVPVDLPRLSEAALRGLVAEFETGSDVLIVTDRRRDGTNVLLWRPLVRAAFRYGEGSARQHAEAAAAQMLSVSLRSDPHLSLDLDTAEDLSLWRQGRDSRDPIGGLAQHVGRVTDMLGGSLART